MAKKVDTPAVEPAEVITEPVVEPTPATEPPKEPKLDDFIEEPVEPGTEPDPPAEPAVEPEPQPVEPPAAEPPPVDVTQSPEYKKILAENEQMSSIRDIVLGNENIYKAVEDTLRNQSQPQPQTTEPKTIPMPTAPQYLNVEDLGDANSETSRYFAQREQVVAENVKNTTMAAMDQKFAQNEQQNAEKVRQNNLAQSAARVREEVKFEENRANEAMNVWNDPSKFNTDLIVKELMIAGDNVRNATNGNVPQTPKLRPDTPPVTPQPIVKKAPPPPGLPTYSSIGGSTTEPNTETEDEFLNRDLMGNLEKQGRRYTNRK